MLTLVPAAAAPAAGLRAAPPPGATARARASATLRSPGGSTARTAPSRRRDGPRALASSLAPGWVGRAARAPGHGAPAPSRPRRRHLRRRAVTDPALRSLASRASSEAEDKAAGDVSDAAHAPDSPAAFAAREAELARLRPLRDALLASGSDLAARAAVVDADPTVRAFVAAKGPVARALSNIDAEDAYLLRCVVACGQADAALRLDSDDPVHVANAVKPLCATMRNVERFYDMIGGVVGYQFAALELVHEAFGGPPATVSEALGQMDSDAASSSTASPGSPSSSSFAPTCEMHAPVGPDLRSDSGAFARRAAAWGLEELPRMAEVYPLGGAGDRLGLSDPETGESLPAALLNYNGRTLIEGLIRDLTAREWLYYKTHGSQVRTPVAVMTSAAKGNHRRMTALMEERGWFGRGRDAFRLFEQPLVPVVTVDCARWVSDDQGGKECSVALKPGGHGAIWKLMHDDGVFTWLAGRGRVGATVRQITNPMAGTDTTMLALSGIGAKRGKALGFACCERHAGAAEGVNVLVERRDASGAYSYGVSNVEYTVLEQHGIEDAADERDGESRFPANTNVLYVGLESVREALLRSPKGAFPGMLVNLSKPVTPDGTRGGRLETSMQNIADVLTAHPEEDASRRAPENSWENLPTFAMYTLRRRITSSAKKKRDPANPNLAQTPDGSFLDLLRNASDLLDRCGVAHPSPTPDGAEGYLRDGPGFIFSANPAIGPLWDVTAQKVRGGCLEDRAEVRLEAAEVDWENVRVAGSLLVEATHPLGGTEKSSHAASSEKSQREGTAEKEPPRLVFDDARCGRVRLKDVVVKNRGVDWAAPGTQAWSATLTRREACEIIVRGDGEFDAEGVELRGDRRYEVPAGFRLQLRPFGPRKKGVEERWTALEATALKGRPTWRWACRVGDGGMIELEREEASAKEIPAHGATLEEAANAAREWKSARGASDGFRTRKGEVGATKDVAGVRGGVKGGVRGGVLGKKTSQSAKSR